MVGVHVPPHPRPLIAEERSRASTELRDLYDVEYQPSPATTGKLAASLCSEGVMGETYVEMTTSHRT
jgi:hypothetical protein